MAGRGSKKGERRSNTHKRRCQADPAIPRNGGILPTRIITKDYPGALPPRELIQLQVSAASPLSIRNSPSIADWQGWVNNGLTANGWNLSRKSTPLDCLSARAVWPGGA